ncbi:MAG: DUF6510 family protein [Thermoleophilaceae bacterium]
MIETHTHLDGNAAAGLLAQAFSADMTTAMCTCAACGRTNALASARLYPAGPGHVLRCVVCESVLMRMAELPGRVMFDAAGVRRMMLSDAS